MRSPRLEEFMSSMEPNSVAVLFSAPEVFRNNDTDYEFRQDSDFFALTRLSEPESVAVISPGHETHKYVLFVRRRDKEKEIWNGLRTGVEGAVSDDGADAAYEISQLGEMLPKYLAGNQKLYSRFGQREESQAHGRTRGTVPKRQHSSRQGNADANRDATRQWPTQPRNREQSSTTGERCDEASQAR